MEDTNNIEEITQTIQNANLKALVVEDDPVNQMLLQEILKSLNVTATIAENGTIAAEKAAANSYDVIFMDIEMPGLNGIEATEKIRSLGNQTTIIACTASQLDEDQRNYLDAGMNHCITKPISKKAIIRILRKCIG